MKLRSVFFVPVFNQVQEFPLVLSELRSSRLACDKILLVNNGSTDGSEKLVQDSGFEFIDLPRNLGVGHSFMHAIKWAITNGYDLFGSLAGNGKMLPQEMGRLLAPIHEGRADYVTGSRFLPGGDFPNLPPFRRLSIPMVNLFVKAITGVTLTDATCGYRVFRVDLIRRAQFDWNASWLNTYGFEYYLYCKVITSKTVRWMEVPVTMRYPGQGKRYSKIRPVIGWYEMLKPWLMARFDGAGFAASEGPFDGEVG